MKEYQFSGEIEQGRQVQPFERSVKAESSEHAREKLYGSLCSEHSVKRTKVEIQNEEEA
ncbi:MAG: 50S ribosomal protein L18Ae [Candidatus Nanohaloarchaea archaeon]